MSLNHSHPTRPSALSRSPRLVMVVGVFLLLSFPFIAAMRAQAPLLGRTYVLTGPIRVIEADTLEVSLDGKRVGVGLVGVKAPAGNTACGRQAIAALNALIAQGVELRDDARAPLFDKRNRRMFHISLLPLRTSLAVSLALAGLVSPDPDVKDNEDALDITAALTAARTSKRGCAQ